jgi:hypothetical protein
MLSPLFTVLFLVFIALNLAYAASLSSSYCLTQYGTSSLRVVTRRTTTIRSTYPSTLRVLSFPTKTITPPAVTQMISDYETVITTRTADQETGTITIPVVYGEATTIED